VALNREWDGEPSPRTRLRCPNPLGAGAALPRYQQGG